MSSEQQLYTLTMADDEGDYSSVAFNKYVHDRHPHWPRKDMNFAERREFDVLNEDVFKMQLEIDKQKLHIEKQMGLMEKIVDLTTQISEKTVNVIHKLNELEKTVKQHEFNELDDKVFNLMEEFVSNNKSDQSEPEKSDQNL